MKNEYDLKNAIKNPFAGKFNGKYTVIVEHSKYNELIEVEVSKDKEILVKKLKDVDKVLT